MAAQPALLSPEEYLRREEEAEVRHEFIAGRVYAMAGATMDHIQIVQNLTIALHEALKGTGCQHFETEAKVWIDAWQVYYYPDSMIACPPNVLNARLGIIDNPIVVIEVLSESTEATDRGAKFAAYATLPSVREYVLIDSREYRAQIYTREGEADKWLEREIVGTSGSIDLAPVGRSIDLGAVYEGVTL